MAETSNIGGGEPHYPKLMKLLREQGGAERLGLMTGWAWYDDPRHLLFTLSRYKFVAKMLAGRECVLEVGCADGFATRLVAQTVKSVVAVDFDPQFIADAIERKSKRWPIDFRIHDIMAAPVPDTFDGAFTLDVIEHIPRQQEDRFLENIRTSLSASGILIVGTPSLASQQYASPQSKEGHVNCKTAEELKATLLRHFEQVFVFSMNDEVVHTGYSNMAHYLMALCCSPADATKSGEN
ncbi:MAG TPA: class I SAM-dependent methyltransferase [Xanthobacteraceae bacterium]|jgi:2-polyprenyl-3-methyl-5-hydroxy-6-metoxy-1,4-benzoquinol methylase|nr:class I SAM-dependent methyltransferase [Xanthobacteraceae bacterium]